MKEIYSEENRGSKRSTVRGSEDTRDLQCGDLRANNIYNVIIPGHNSCTMW